MKKLRNLIFIFVIGVLFLFADKVNVEADEAVAKIGSGEEWSCSEKAPKVYKNELKTYGISVKYENKKIIVTETVDFKHQGDADVQGSDPIKFNIKLDVSDKRVDKTVTDTIEDSNGGESATKEFKLSDLCTSTTTCSVDVTVELDVSTDKTLLNRGDTTRKTCWEKQLDYRISNKEIDKDTAPGETLADGRKATYSFNLELIFEGGYDSNIIYTNKESDTNPKVTNPHYDTICKQFRGETELSDDFYNKLCTNNFTDLCNDSNFLNNKTLTDLLNGNNNMSYYKKIVGSYCYNSEVTALTVYQKESTLLDILATGIKTLYVKKYSGDAADKTLAEEDGNGTSTTVNEVFEKWKSYAQNSGNDRTGSDNVSDTNVCYSDVDQYLNYGNVGSGKSYVYNSGTKKWLTTSGTSSDILTKSVEHDGSEFLNVEYYYKETKTYKNADFEYHLSTNTTKNDVTSSNDNVCSITCGEAVKVAYYPPQIVRGGVCFQYEVKVVSYVKCTTDFNDELNVITGDDCTSATCDKGKPTSLYNKYVNPIPMCVHNQGSSAAWTGKAAGPSEDFEECVNTCDGGVYSESCSKSCYKKVYGKDLTTEEMNAINSTYNVTNLKSSSTSVENTFGSVSSGHGFKRITKLSDDLKKCLKSNPEGCYYYDKGAYHWYSTDKGWDAAEKTVGSVKYQYGYKNVLLNVIKSGSLNANFAMRDMKAMGRYYADFGYYPMASNYWTSSSSRSTLSSNANTTITKNALSNISNISNKYTMAYRVFSADKDWDDGFRKIYYFNYANNARGSAISSCSASCSWAEPSALTNNQAYLNPYVYQNDLKDNVSEYAKKVYSCIAAAKCSTTTATFKMSVKYNDDEKGTTTINYPYSTTKVTSSSGSSSTTTYNQSTTCESTEDKLCTTSTDSCASGTNSPAILQNPVILSYGGCYYQSGAKAQQNESLVTEASKNIKNRYYKTIIGFPGVWENLKGGGTYKYGCYPGEGYIFNPNQFCVDKNDNDVNRNYYNNYVNYKLKGKSESECASCGKDSITTTTTGDEAKTSFNSNSSDGWNIKAEVSDFGLYGWNFDVYCFYSSIKGYNISTSSDSNTTTSSSSDSTSCNSCSTGENSSLSLRAADNSNLFTSDAIADGTTTDSTENKSTSSSTTKGYNWQSTTSNTKNKMINASTEDTSATQTYSIDPQRIIDYIEKTESSGETYEEENADYIVTITAAGIQKLKEYVKNNNGDYTAGFSDLLNIDSKSGMLTYNSKILGNSSNYGITIVKRSGTGTNTTHVSVNGN